MLVSFRRTRRNNSQITSSLAIRPACAPLTFSSVAGSRVGAQSMTDPVGRMELFARLGRITVAEAMVNEAASYAAERAWRQRLSGEFDRNLPDNRGWHTSMHVSSFPGDDPRACPRRLAYGMMGFAETEVLPQRVPAAGIVGTAIEDWLVSMLDLDGRVLSIGSEAEHQIDLEDADHWLTGSPDLVVLPKFWNRPLVLEIKGEKLERVLEMRALKRSYWPKHGRQLRGYVGLGHDISPVLWPKTLVCRHTWRIACDDLCLDHGAESDCLIEIDLEPIRDGVVVYCARDNPEIRASFYFEHDEAWFQKGLAVLRRAQEAYAVGKIPAHPFGGKQWSAQPCAWCSMKKNTCKPDQQAGVTKLTESHGVEWSRGVYGDYDPETVRQQVLDRWRGREGLGYSLPPGYEIGRYGVQKERDHATHP